MNLIKRSYDFYETDHVYSKKSRTTFSTKYSSIPICFEHLPNELLLEIFDYLDAYDIYRGFSHLNIRFSNLLLRSSLPLKTRIRYESKSTIEYRCRHVIIPNVHRLLSLHLHTDSIIHDFFNYCNLDSSFTRLESIVLNGVPGMKLLMILSYLQSLSRLFSLTILLEEDCLYTLNDIYRLIFRLPVLKYNKLSLSEYDEINITIPIMINQTFSTIEHLIIDFTCNIDELTSLLYYTPRLRYLTCKRISQPEEMNQKELPLSLTNLVHCSFILELLTFDLFEVFLKKISTQLQFFRLQTSFDRDYLDEKRWRSLIKKHMPHLQTFHFEYCQMIEFADDDLPNHEAIKQFTSTFWTERQWYFEFKDYFDRHLYLIHPFKKTWFNSSEHEQIINENTFDTSLTIEGYASDTWDTFSFNNMKLSLQATGFTHLNIDCNGILINMFIELIRLLPNLTSLEVSSLPSTQLNFLSTEDNEMLLLVSITNRITKVRINRIDIVDDMNFLMNLCPRMKYLEVIHITNSNLENILGTISMNNITRIPYLNCLSLYTAKSKETIIDDIHHIIDFERLFHIENAFRDYEFQCIGQKIYLKWRL